MSAHQITGNEPCAVCGVTVKGSARAWAGSCPGVRWYAWEQIPPELATRTALAREGLRPADPHKPAGYYIAWSRRTCVLLFDRRQAVAKRKATSAAAKDAREAGAARLRALRTCSGCGRLVKSARYLYAPASERETGRLCPECHTASRSRAALAAVYQHARGILAEAERSGGHPVRILDTETTGLGEQDEPIEIAIVDGVSGQVLMNTRLRPTFPITPDAQAVHQIGADELAESPRLVDVWPQICEALKGSLVMAYNAAFDRRILGQAADRYQLKQPRWQWWCLMEACTVFDDPDDGRWFSLGIACELAGAERVGQAHGALGDALTARALVHALAARAAPTQEQEG